MLVIDLSSVVLAFIKFIDLKHSKFCQFCNFWAFDTIFPLPRLILKEENLSTINHNIIPQTDRQFFKFEVVKLSVHNERLDFRILYHQKKHQNFLLNIGIKVSPYIQSKNKKLLLSHWSLHTLVELAKKVLLFACCRSNLHVALMHAEIYIF